MTASMEPLTDEAARRIDAFVFSGGSNGPVIAAMAVLEIAEIAEGLRAARIVAALREQHQPRRWGPDSASESCTCGAAGCSVRQALQEGAE